MLRELVGRSHSYMALMGYNFDKSWDQFFLNSSATANLLIERY